MNTQKVQLSSLIYVILKPIPDRFEGFTFTFQSVSYRSVRFVLEFPHIPLCASLQIEDGEIYASINQKDGMVCFHDNPEKYNNPAMLHKIDQEVKMPISIFSVVLLYMTSYHNIKYETLGIIIINYFWSKAM